jgi:uncharacterized membrane protein YpjA
VPAHTTAHGLVEEGWAFLERFARERTLLALLVVINLGGVAYGFYYYAPQFAITPAWLWPWVPDSPVSVGFFALAMGSWTGWRSWPT